MSEKLVRFNLNTIEELSFNPSRLLEHIVKETICEKSIFNLFKKKPCKETKSVWIDHIYEYEFDTDDELIEWYDNEISIINSDVYEKAYLKIRFCSGITKKIYYDSDEEAFENYFKIKEKINAIKL